MLKTRRKDVKNRAVHLRYRMLNLAGFAAILSLASASGCHRDKKEADEAMGTMRAALIGSGMSDVVSMRVDVSNANGPVESRTVAVSKQVLNGVEKPGGDAFFVLRPGPYHVVATPINAAGAASPLCAKAESDAVVAIGKTTEIVLVMVCGDEGSGSLDVVGRIENVPVLTDLSLKPSKFIKTCEPLVAKATAVDPDGDALSFAWLMATTPAGARFRLSPAGDSTTFITETPGEFEIRVAVADPAGHSASLVFPVHVSGEAKTCLANDRDGDGITDQADNCPDVANTNQADTNNNGVGDACEAGPASLQPSGPRPSVILSQLPKTIVKLTAANAEAFIDWASESQVADREIVRAEIQSARGDDAAAAALGSAINKAVQTDHSRALVALSVLGELRNPIGERFLQEFARRPLPTQGTLVEGEIVEQTALAMLEAKAVSGLAYMGSDSGNKAVLEIVSSHPSKPVRAEAARSFLFNNQLSRLARAQLSSALRKDELIFLDRPYRLPGESADTFDQRLVQFLNLHPEVQAPRPEQGKGDLKFEDVAQPNNPEF